MPVLPQFANTAIGARWDAAVETIFHRRLHDTTLKRRMADVAERYEGNILFPLDDVEGEPEFPALAAQIISDAVDGFATRANDTLPTIWAPAIDPTAGSHRKRAETRRQAWGANYYESQLPLKTARAYRQLYGYSTFCFYVQPDFEAKRARITTRDPLLTYPEPLAPEEIRLPRDIGFVYGRSPQWLMSKFPEARDFIRKHHTPDDDLWDILEWVDGEFRFIGILGRRSTQSTFRRFDTQGRVLFGDQHLEQALLLRAWPNRAGVVPAVCPAAVSLARQIAQVSRIVPITDVMNKLAAMQFVASEKSVFPTIVVLGEQGQEPELLGGQFHDGRSGRANLLQNARLVDTLNLTPNQQTEIQMANLERNARLSSGNPSTFQGEGSGAIRSGQTVNQLAAISIDPRLTEAHRTMGYALTAVNEAVSAVELGYWPRRKYTVFSGWQGANRHVKYQPTQVWKETTASVVSYPLPGLDAVNTTTAVAALNQARMLSRKTAMIKHPLVEDQEAEERLLLEEALDDAILMASVGLVSSGQLAFTDLVNIRKFLRQGKSIEEAMEMAQEQAQERQATEAPAPDQGQVTAPQAQPGLNAPEAGGQQPAPTGAGAVPDNPEQFEQIVAALQAAPSGNGAAEVPA